MLTGGRTLPLSLTGPDVEELLGPPPHRLEPLPGHPPPGLALGLVWTENGGQVMPVEAAVMRGTGKLAMTGSLGKVLRESAQTALGYIRSRAGEFGLAPEMFGALDIHVHIPAGAMPKDGPSAGVTIAAALLSALTGRVLQPGTAMTGEITLTGRVLRVSGLRDKLLAAEQMGISRVIAPAANEPDVAQLGEELSAALQVAYVDRLDQALEMVLGEA